MTKRDGKEQKRDTGFRKRSPDGIRALFPDDSVHKAFLEREDIAALAPEEQERKWAEHKENLTPFLKFLSNTDSVVVDVPPRGKAR